MQGENGILREERFAGRTKTGLYRQNKKGFGFVTVEGEEEDYYIRRDQTGGAFHMDTVAIVPLAGFREHRKEARVVSVVSRATSTVIGVRQ